jgi:xanthine dehydrogenase YagS FAD-binding subunit
LRAFEYSSPASAEEAIPLLTRDARPLAGGTDLLPLMKSDLVAPSRLVDVKQFLDDDIREGTDALRIGALTVLDEVEKNPVIQTRYTALAEAAAVAASPQLRNMATIGGNLLQRPRCWYFRNPRIACWLKGGEKCPAKDGENKLHALYGGGPCYAVHPSDLAGALVALGAAVRVRSKQGESLIPCEDFFILPNDARRTETVLVEDELIVAVEIPRAQVRSAYLKAMERKLWTFAMAGVAVAVRRSGARVEHARVVLTGVAPMPWRATGAEDVLLGEEWSERLMSEAAEAALEGAAPLAHNGYKIPLLKTLVRRALSAAGQ